MEGPQWELLIPLAVSEKIFRNRPIRNKNCLWQPYLLMDWDELSSLYREPPIPPQAIIVSDWSISKNLLL
jgi:hypothetical protein